MFVCPLVPVVWATETSGAMDTQPLGHRVSSAISTYLQRSYNVMYMFVRGWRVPPMASVTVDLYLSSILIGSRKRVDVSTNVSMISGIDNLECS